jgi:hypothetical protein
LHSPELGAPNVVEKVPASQSFVAKEEQKKTHQNNDGEKKGVSIAVL